MIPFSHRGKMHDKWGINLYLEKVQVKIEVKIKPDIFIGSVNLNIFPGSNL
jgi:hypothetical protein